MDEMKLKLGTKVMKGFIANIITNIIRNKLGYDIEIELNEIDVEMINGKMRIHANVDAEIDNAEIFKIMKTIKLK